MYLQYILLFNNFLYKIPYRFTIFFVVSIILILISVICFK